MASIKMILFVKGLEAIGKTITSKINKVADKAADTVSKKVLSALATKEEVNK